MHAVGITGGIGSGKSTIIDYLEEKYDAYVLKADEMAHKLIEKDNVCYPAIVELLGEDILNEDKSIDRKKMGDKIFQNEDLRLRVNGIIHPAVKELIILELEKCSGKGLGWLFVEAALMVEEDYGSFLDEIWYVYAPTEMRAQRLKDTRGYSDEKIAGIMASQLSEEKFEDYCDILIDNSGKPEEAYAQIDILMKSC